MEELFIGLPDIQEMRFSARNYTNKKIEMKKLDKILNIAHVAPTATNLQPIRFLVVQEDAGLAKL